MLKNLLVMLIIFIFVIFSLHSIYSSNDPVMGLITKVILDVTKKSKTGDWTKAEKGQTVYSGDYIRTGKKSLAVIKFKDNSMLRVREQSELKIISETVRGLLSKDVEAERGSLGFDIKKQEENQQFVIKSPTSVASIRGTRGSFIIGISGDTLIVTDGLVNLLNLLTRQAIDVRGGFIAFSNLDGTLSSREATEEEINRANWAIQGTEINELDMEFRDSQGNRKNLRLKFKERE